MKKLTLIICFVLVSALLFGCRNKEEAATQGSMQLGNPWKSYETLSDAESAAGFALGIPETIDGCTASVFRVMSNSLLEVTYKNADVEVTVRKQAGEGQDISGDYTEYPTISEADGVTVRTDGTDVSIIISHGGYSWSVYCTDGLTENAQQSFINAVTGG